MTKMALLTQKFLNTPVPSGSFLELFFIILLIIILGSILESIISKIF